jgi:hypothetical protein
MLVAGMCASLVWGAFTPAVYDLTHRCCSEEGGYLAYVCDRELFLNVGRVSGMGVLLLATYLFSFEVVLHVGPVVFGIGQLALLLPAWKMHLGAKVAVNLTAVNPTASNA